MTTSSTHRAPTLDHPTGLSMRIKTGVTLVLASLALAGCSADRLLVPNYNSPTGEDVAQDPDALQLTANGLLAAARGNMGGWISGTGRLGREAYSYTPTEGRNTTPYLMGPQDPTRGAGNSFWGGYYGGLRDMFNFSGTVTASERLTDTQKEAALGFARTLEGMELSFVVAAHGDFGAPVQIMDDPRELATFVSRDSVYNTAIAM